MLLHIKNKKSLRGAPISKCTLSLGKPEPKLAFFSAFCPPSPTNTSASSTQYRTLINADSKSHQGPTIMQKLRVLSRQLLKQQTAGARTSSVRRYSTATRLNADHVRIVEVGPRDGLQNEKKSISLETKLELINKLAKTGVTTIEAGSFVPAKWVPQVSSKLLSSLHLPNQSIDQ